MTTIYKPALIESAEQAEALPVGTVAYIEVIGGPARYSAVKTPAGDWYIGGRECHKNREMVRWTALVPIEARESRDEGVGWIVPTAFGPKLAGAYLGSPDDTPAKRYTQTTWRTPWEEA